jgi:hypothetical protein
MAREYWKSQRGVKVNLYMTDAEKVAWWERLNEYGFSYMGLSKGIKQVMQHTLGYGVHIDFKRRGFYYIERVKKAVPPPCEPAFLDLKNYPRETVIGLTVKPGEEQLWREEMYRNTKIRSLRAFVLDTVRKTLSIPPYGLYKIDAEV